MLSNIIALLVLVFVIVFGFTFTIAVTAHVARGTSVVGLGKNGQDYKDFTEKLRASLKLN